MDIINKYEYENLVAIACEENDVNTLIKLHKELIGKNVKPYEHLDKIVDGGVKLVFDLFGRDEGRSIVYNYSCSESEFIHSTYLSSYFKDSIKKLLGDSIEEELANILNSDKDINDMEEEEIKVIKDTLDSFYSNPNYKPVSNIAASFMTYLYKLDGEGVTSYIKNNISKEKIACQIMFTSGLNPSASRYSGRGVKECDLNANNLEEIFNKLCVLDKDYALEFVEMVNSMKTLGATEFIESFYNFVWNGFKHFDENVVDSNISFGNSNESRHAIALGTIMSTIHSSDMGIQIYYTEEIKHKFMKKIRVKLMKAIAAKREKDNKDKDKDNFKIRIIIPRNEVKSEFIELCNCLEKDIVDENHVRNGGTLNYDRLTYSSDILLVAYNGDIPIAFNALVFHGKNLLYCNQYAVKKGFQKHGIGKIIMAEAIEIADIMDVDFSAHVKDYNIASQRVFTSLGFKKIDNLREPDNYYYCREIKRNFGKVYFNIRR